MTIQYIKKIEQITIISTKDRKAITFNECSVKIEYSSSFKEKFSDVFSPKTITQAASEFSEILLLDAIKRNAFLKDRDPSETFELSITCTVRGESKIIKVLGLSLKNIRELGNIHNEKVGATQLLSVDSFVYSALILSRSSRLIRNEILLDRLLSNKQSPETISLEVLSAGISGLAEGTLELIATTLNKAKENITIADLKNPALYDEEKNEYRQRKQRSTLCPPDSILNEIKRMAIAYGHQDLVNYVDCLLGNNNGISQQQVVPFNGQYETTEFPDFTTVMPSDAESDPVGDPCVDEREHSLVSESQLVPPANMTSPFDLATMMMFAEQPEQGHTVTLLDIYNVQVALSQQLQQFKAQTNNRLEQLESQVRDIQNQMQQQSAPGPRLPSVATLLYSASLYQVVPDNSGPAAKRQCLREETSDPDSGVGNGASPLNRFRFSGSNHS